MISPLNGKKKLRNHAYLYQNGWGRKSVEPFLSGGINQNSGGINQARPVLAGVSGSGVGPAGTTTIIITSLTDWGLVATIAGIDSASADGGGGNAPTGQTSTDSIRRAGRQLRRQWWRRWPRGGSVDPVSGLAPTRRHLVGSAGRTFFCQSRTHTSRVMARLSPKITCLWLAVAEPHAVLRDAEFSELGVQIDVWIFATGITLKLCARKSRWHESQLS